MPQVQQERRGDRINGEALELLKDPSTPYWAQMAIRSAMSSDCVDAANTFTVLAQVFNRRCEALLGPGGWEK